VALIPVYDLYNHEEGEITTSYALGSDLLKVTAIRDFKTGEQVKIFYGNRPNSELLLYQGFIFNNNHRDFVLALLALDPDSKLYEQQAKLLAAHELPKAAFFQLKKGEISELVIHFLRVASLEESEILLGEKAFEKTFISLKNEIKAYLTLLLACKNMLAKYPTKLQQDTARLKAGGLPLRATLSLQLIISEKTILLNNLEICDTKVKQLTRKLKQKEKRKKPVSSQPKEALEQSNSKVQELVPKEEFTSTPEQNNVSTNSTQPVHIDTKSTDIQNNDINSTNHQPPNNIQQSDICTNSTDHQPTTHVENSSAIS